MSKLQKTQQAMPPPGGFPPFSFRRLMGVWGKPGWSLKITAILCAGIGLGLHQIKKTQKSVYENSREVREFYFAMLPILWAENDRKILRQMVRNREEEAELMKDNPDWIVGESVYFSRHFPVNTQAHCDAQDIYPFESRKSLFNRMIGVSTWI